MTPVEGKLTFMQIELAEVVFDVKAVLETAELSVTVPVFVLDEVKL